MREQGTTTMHLNTTAELIADIKAGRMIILMDDEDRENEGDLVLAADCITPEAVNFMAKHGRGLICLALTGERCRKLNLPLMVTENRSSFRTNFTMSIEAATGVTTGISAADRARTIQAAVAANAKPEDLVQPGHVFPLMAQDGGVLVRAGQTEGSVDLARLSGREPAGVICEILKDDGNMARLPDLLEFAREHKLKVGTIADLIEYRSHAETLVERVARKALKTPYGEFELIAYRDRAFEQVHLALVMGRVDSARETLVRVHGPLSVMDFLDDEPREHSFTVAEAMRAVAAKGEGVIVLLRQTERGEDLLARITPPAASTGPAARWDPRSHGIGAQILRDLGVGKMRLLARPQKLPSMAGFGLEVAGYLAPEKGNET
jgi:3,4-dihydroxy 2-butanone 4-phosphate synthase / GTP cyclohydrolase II